MVPTAGQLMHGLKAQPVFPIRLPKAHLVVLPGSEEVDRAILPPLDHSPAPTLQLLLTPC